MNNLSYIFIIKFRDASCHVRVIIQSLNRFENIDEKVLAYLRNSLLRVIFPNVFKIIKCRIQNKNFHL
jgi:hypothetical protein